MLEIPSYKIIKELGRGGMATVYLAEQVLLKRQVAIKVMSITLNEDATFRERFLKEGQIVAKLEHPGIVKIYEINALGDIQYIAMELVPGGSLQERLLKGLSIEEAVNVISQIADVLGFALEKGYIHRDIKPANILFRADGTPVLTDFGIAKEIADASLKTKTGTAMGTPTYMSPEQAMGQVVDGRSDLYSLGIMFYEMLVGQPPYQADSPIATALMHVTEPIPRLPEKLAFFQPVIDGILAKNPQARFTSGDEFLEALNECLGKAPENTRELILKSAPPPLLHTRAMTYLPKRRRWVKPAAAAVGLVLVAVVAMWFLLQPPPLTQAQRLLQTASQQMAAGKVVAPEKDNAYTTYLEVLKLEPKNTAATAGIAKVVEQLALRALAEQQQGNLATAQATVRQGLEIQADHPGLLSVQRTLQEKIITQKREAEILTRLSNAAEAARAGHWFEPVETGAVARYRSVLELDPNNAAALTALNSHADALLAAAKAAQASGQLDTAQQKLTQALTLRPGDATSLALQQVLTRQREQGQMQARLDALIQKAKTQVAQGKLGKPPGDNAYETYQTVLALDPNQVAAKTGIQQLADKQLALAKSAQGKGKLDDALDLLTQGLIFAPEHPGLKQLDATVQAALEKRRQDEQLRQQQAADAARLAQEKVAKEREAKELRAQQARDEAFRKQQEGLAKREEELRKAAAAAPVKGPQRVGTVSRVDAEWGFVVVQLDASAAVKVGERLQLKPGNKALTVKRVSDRTVSALPEGGLADIAAGMEIWSN